MEQLMEILEDLRPDIEFENEKKMIDDGILTSFDIISLVSELNETFDIDITVDELVPDNFNSCENMWVLVQKKQEED